MASRKNRKGEGDDTSPAEGAAPGARDPDENGSEQRAGSCSTTRAVARLAAAQRGILSIDQLRDSGLSRRGAAHQAEAGRLHRVHRGVYSVGHGGIDERGRLVAALLACGEDSVVSHATAAAYWGIVDRAPVLIDVTVPCQTGRRVEGIRARRCRYPEPEEIVVHDGIRCTTPARTLVDLAGQLRRMTLRAAIEQAAMLRLLDLGSIDRSIYHATGRRGLRTLERLLIPWRRVGPTIPELRSRLEARFLSLVHEEILPSPLVNHRLRLDDGTTVKADMYWPDRRLIIELDGGETHDTPNAFEKDRRRDQELSIMGLRVVRFTWSQVFDEPERVSRVLRVLLG